MRQAWGGLLLRCCLSQQSARWLVRLALIQVLGPLGKDPASFLDFFPALGEIYRDRALLWECDRRWQRYCWACSLLSASGWPEMQTEPLRSLWSSWGLGLEPLCLEKPLCTLSGPVSMAAGCSGLSDRVSIICLKHSCLLLDWSKGVLQFFP